MRIKQTKGAGSIVTILVVAALALAATGVLYAHWTDQLDATIGVQTGDLDVKWVGAGTDDDGILRNDMGLTPDDPTAPVLYDMWRDSSADPAEPFAASRYDKDVARCQVREIVGEEELLYVFAENTYPSYHCGLYTSVENTATIPVKASFFELAVTAGPPGDEVLVDPDRIVYLAEGKVALLSEDLSETEVTLDIAEGIRCGTQIDPGEAVPVKGWFHVEQGAEENAGYGFYIHQQFMNWNEWTPDFCTPGAVIANPDGSPYSP